LRRYFAALAQLWGEMDSARKDKTMAYSRLQGLFLALLLVAPVVHAAGGGNEAKERAARRACLRGNTDKGVEILTDLYLSTKDANLIFNQARCYALSHRYEDAIARFREYLLTASNATDAEKAEAQKHIAACLSFLGKTEAPAAVVAAPASPPPVAPPTNAQPAPVVPPQTPPAQPVITIQQPVQPSSSGSGLRTAGVVTASAGGALLITGVILNLKINSMSKDLESHYLTSTNSSRENYKTFSQVSFGVGAACVAGGAVLYYLGVRSGRVAQVTLAPVVAPGMAGAIFGGSF
jgi:serine/threonine-protein kinase